MPDYLLEGVTSERLIYRKVRPTDQFIWFPFFKDPESTRYWEGIPSDPEIACTEQFQRIFERYDQGLGGMNALIRKADQALVGLCGLLLQNVDNQQELEIGYSLLPEYRGKGYATEAALKCKEIAKTHRWAESLISIIHIANLPSQKVAIQTGMHRDFQTTYNGNPVYIYRVNL